MSSTVAAAARGNGAGGGTKQRPSPPSALKVIPVLSAIGGLAIHILAVRLAPKNQLNVLFGCTVSQLATGIKLSDAWPGWLRGVGASTDPKHRSALKVLLVLLAFFRDMLSSQLGKGILWLLATASMPLILHIVIESGKAGRHWLLGPLNIIIVSSIGQVFCLGGATSIVSVASHAYARYAQIVSANDRLNASKKVDDQDEASRVTLDDVVHPLPSEGFVKANIAALLSGLVIVTIALSIHVDTQKYPQAWAASNIAFQFFPIFFIPLLLPPLAAATKKAAPHKPGSVVTPRLSSAEIYKQVAFITVPLWWYGLVLSAGPVFSKLANAGRGIDSLGGIVNSVLFLRKHGWQLAFTVAFPLSHGEWLLFWDLVGILIALTSVVWVDQAADDWADALFNNRVVGYRRPHEKRFLLEDLIIGLPSALILGPGFAGARYFQRREHLAERVRLMQ